MKNYNPPAPQRWSKREIRVLCDRERGLGTFVLRSLMANLGASSSAATPEPVVLTAADIPRTELSVPYEAHPVPALKWWLLCRGIKAPSSWSKQQLIER